MSTIKRSKLNDLIHEIVKVIVKEIHDKKLSEESGTSNVSPSIDPLKKKIIPEDDTINEMTTTDSGTPGYNVPGAFTNKMNRKDRIEVLGYEMTPAGKKEYNRPGDRKL